MEALPEDLVPEILLKLPVKSLLRFRCICKSWNHLIRSSDFIKKHLKHHSTRKDYILISRTSDPHSYDHFRLPNYIYTPMAASRNLHIPQLSLYSYDSLSLISDLRIPRDGNASFRIELCGPCNGLICILMGDQDVILCNPFLKECKLLPPRPFPTSPGYHYHWSHIAVGFEFDSWTEGYKVVRIIMQLQGLYYESIYAVEVYEHNSHSWRQIKNHMLKEQNARSLTPGTNWNEMIHWINCDKEILSFDIKTEVFQLHTLPSDPQEEGKHMSLIVLHEVLAAFACSSSFDPTDQFIDLWKMENYGVEESWTKVFTIGPLSGIHAPRLLWKDETIILEAFELPLEDAHPAGNLYTCSVATLKMEDLQMTGKLGSFRVMICNESLISIN